MRHVGDKGRVATSQTVRGFPLAHPCRMCKISLYLRLSKHDHRPRVVEPSTDRQIISSRRFRKCGFTRYDRSVRGDSGCNAKTRTDYMNGMARVPCPSPGVRFPKARTVVLETICITEQGEMLLAISSIVAGHLSVCGLVIVMI